MNVIIKIAISKRMAYSQALVLAGGIAHVPILITALKFADNKTLKLNHQSKAAALALEKEKASAAAADAAAAAAAAAEQEAARNKAQQAAAESTSESD